MLSRVAWAKIRMAYQERVAFRLALGLEVLSTCSMLVVFLLIDRFQGHLLGGKLGAASEKLGTSYFGYVTVGLAVSSLSSLSLGGVLGQYHEERRLRMMPLVLASPLSLWDWALAAGAANLVRAFFQFVLILGVAVGILGLRFPAFSPWAAMGVLIAGLPALWALSVISLACALLFRRGDPLGFLMGISLEILGGVYVPLEVLPAKVRMLSYAIPLGPALEAMHRVLAGSARMADIAGSLELLLVLGVVYLPLAYLALRWADQRARRSGVYFLS